MKQFFSMSMLPIEKLHMFAEYQRNSPVVNKAVIAAIVKDFEPFLLSPLLVSKRRDGTYWVIDGQSRAVALGRLGYVEVPAYVRLGLTMQEEAEMYVRAQTGRKQLTKADLFRARLVYREKLAIVIAETLNGQRIGVPGDGSGFPVCRSVESLEQLYKRWGQDILGRAARISVSAYSPNVALQGQRIRAIAECLGRSGSSIDDKRLVSVLSSVADPVLRQMTNDRKYKSFSSNAIYIPMSAAMATLYSRKYRASIDMTQWEVQ